MLKNEYIYQESKNNFKNWTKEGLNFLQKYYQNIKDKNERKRIRKILEKLNLPVLVLVIFTLFVMKSPKHKYHYALVTPFLD